MWNLQYKLIYIIEINSCIETDVVVKEEGGKGRIKDLSNELSVSIRWPKSDASDFAASALASVNSDDPKPQ